MITIYSLLSFNELIMTENIVAYQNNMNVSNEESNALKDDINLYFYIRYAILNSLFSYFFECTAYQEMLGKSNMMTIYFLLYLCLYEIYCTLAMLPKQSKELKYKKRLFSLLATCVILKYLQKMRLVKENLFSFPFKEETENVGSVLKLTLSFE